MNKLCSYKVYIILGSTVNDYIRSQGLFTENISNTTGSISKYSEILLPYRHVLTFCNT